MYATDLGEQTLTLGVSGMLWENSLVMVDSETGSLWSQLLGECMRGPLTGTRLEILPSVMTTWGSWKSRNPHSTVVVLPRSSFVYDRSMLDVDGGLLIGLHNGSFSKSWDLSSLHEKVIWLDTFEDVPVVVFLDHASLTAVIYDRRIDDQVLTFERQDSTVTDAETGSTWDLVSGRAVTGPLQGRMLTLMPGIISDSAVWSIYHPLERPPVLWRH